MKKLLSVLMLIALTSTLAVSAAESRLQNYVDKKLAPITTKEKELNARAEAQQKANAQKQAEYKKQQEARKAKIEQQQKEAKARHEATKNAIQSEANYWKSLKK